MSAIGDLDSIPWVPQIPKGALSAYEQARELLRVREEGRLSTGSAAQILGLDSFTVSCLRYVWRASPPLRQLLRVTRIAPYPAAVLVQLEQFINSEALTLGRGYAKEVIGLVELENRLATCQCAGSRTRSGPPRMLSRLRGRRG